MSTFLRHTTPMVFLRPNPFTVPTVQRTEVITGAITSMPMQQLAIFTCKMGPNQGPKGDKGDDFNSWFDCVLTACSDETSELKVDVEIPKVTYRAPYPIDLTMGYIRASVTHAPLGADLIIDVHMNGTTIFTTLLHIDAGARTSVGATIPYEFNTLYIPDDAEFQVFVTQRGSTVGAGGAGLKVCMTGIKTV